MFVNTASVRTLQFLAPMLNVVHKRNVSRDSINFPLLPKMTVTDMLEKNIFQGFYILLIIIVLVTIQLNLIILF